MSTEAETQIVHEPNHDEAAINELLFVNRQKPRIRALVLALAKGVQLLEDLTFDLIVSKRLGIVSGRVLDQFGKLVGEQRQGLSDADYRRFIRARIRANLSEGTRDEIIEIWETITKANASRYFDCLPAAYALVAFRDTFMDDGLARRVVRFMESIEPAGVGADYIEALEPVFTYDDGPGYDEGQYARLL